MDRPEEMLAGGSTAGLIGRFLRTPKGLYRNDLVLQFDRFDRFAAPPPGCATSIDARHRHEYLMRVHRTEGVDSTQACQAARQRAQQAGTGPGVELADYLAPEAFCAAGEGGELQLRVSLSLPSLRVKAVPVRPLRIMPASLLTTLEGIGRRGSVQTGTLTMDSTRRLLPLMSGDPKSVRLSLVGLWITGLPGEGLDSPQAWAACR